jgi:membrane associated rhomboid family serine protease
VQAPVGFQCPACVSEGASRVPPVRTPLGGVARRQPRRATGVLIAVNALVYALTLAGADRLIVDYGLLGVAVASGEWWRLLTAAFLHAGLWHVGLNMLALWILGGVVEPLLGRWRFVAVYAVSALGGAVASYAFSSPVVFSVGASGAVFGLLGATLVVLRRLNRDVSGVVALLLVNVAIGFAIPSIDWRAHLGGLLAGAVVTTAMVAVPRRYSAAAAWAAAAVLLAGMAWVVDWRTSQILALAS